MNLDNHQPSHFKHRAEETRKQQKEMTLLGVARKIKGLRLYEYNKETGEIKEAEYLPNDTLVFGEEMQSKVHVRPGCVYVQAMNKKNGVKHALRLLNN
jgi:hypothetical protein